MARHAGPSKPRSKPVQLYVRLSFRPLGHQADHVGYGNFKVFILSTTAAAAFVYFFNTLSATRVRNSFQELCNTLAAADNSFTRVLNPHGGAYVLSSTDRLFRFIRTLHFIIITMVWRQHWFFWQSIFIHPSGPIILVGPLDGTLCQHRVHECKFYSGQLTMSSLCVCFLWIMRSPLSACLRLNWVVYKMVGMKPYTICFVVWYMLELRGSIIGEFTTSFFSSLFHRRWKVQPYSSTEVAIAWKNPRFILSVRSDFHVVEDM